MSTPLIESLIIGLNIFTPHAAYHDYSNITPGIYAHVNDDLLIGVVRNSYKNASFYAGKTWDFHKFTIILGGATGYDYAPIVPLVSVGWKFDSGIRAQFLPGTHWKGSSVTFSYEWRIK